MAKPKATEKKRTPAKTTRKPSPSAARKPAQPKRKTSSTNAGTSTRKRKANAPALGLLKSEIYGILLITLSVIALSRQAAVGQFLYYISSFILGKVYFVLPLAGIYIGLMTMLRQRWANGWTSRTSGLVLLVCAFTLMSILINVPESQLEALPARQAAGGYVGAVQMWLLLMLFGVTVTKLVTAVMLVISLMLITRMSLVQLMEHGRAIIARIGTATRQQWLASREAIAERRQERELEQQAAEAEAALHEAESLHEEDDASTRSQGLLAWLRRERGAQLEVDDIAAEDALSAEATERIRSTRSRTSRKSEWDETAAIAGERYEVGFDTKQSAVTDPAHSDIHNDLFDNVPVGAVSPAAGEAGITAGTGSATAIATSVLDTDRTPIIRDFFEQIRSEQSVHSDDVTETAGQSASDITFVEATNGSVAHNTVLELEARQPVSGIDIASAQQDGVVQQDAERVSGMIDNVDATAVAASAISTAQPGTAATDALIAETPPPPKPYRLPPFSLLAKPQVNSNAADQNDYMQIARKLETTLESFGVRAKVLEVVRGPAVTRYEIQPDVGVKVSRIVGLTDDIALALAAKDIRMEAPIPGKSAIGIEVPNNEVAMVTMREVMETQVFHESEARLSIAFGRDIAGQTIIGNLAKMPHLLVAGATGSGKSVCINGIITSILYKAKPDEVKFLMVDPKMVELNIYNGIPHLLAPVVTDPRRASLALKKIVVEMEKRYDLFSKSGTRNMEGYNNLVKDNPAAVLPYIVVIVDELADLMMVAAGDVEDAIARLAQMARAAGIHLIIATQRPSVDVITGVIKANIPSRIAFGVSSQIDSRTILDMGGAEKLLGRGDMLFMPVGASKPVRVQGAFMSDQEVEAIVNYCRDQGEAQYNEDIVPEIDDAVTTIEEQKDELFDQAVQIVVEAKQASVSLLQRRMRVGYTRAARLIDSLEAHGIVGPYEGSKPREVLVSPEQYHQIGTGS
ncbi:FtsK/SpoIIIE family DNA translocase [Paenibacillus sp. SGZ-1009]|uniref:FtsK/SpoIIIE family DNA translocase n=1 Tax=Paenibacillus campi TaxID=3106031 RepID=UPI002AFE21A8|nr:DNA translocase FtsK 4TM domain-containing protein [Paenibacillus sp. SGZ-1009]